MGVRLHPTDDFLQLAEKEAVMGDIEQHLVEPDPNVTTLSYHYWDIGRSKEAFRRLEHALRETWRHCGKLKAVIVVNRVDTWVESFAEQHSNVDLQVEPCLTPGKLWSLSHDCIANLHRRFDTDYVLTIQTDGYPLREGLSEFIGKWDYIAAPHICDVWWKRLASDVLQFRPMNGGFSLRSHECCEQVGYWWNRKYHELGDCHETVEDWFYTAYLPRMERSYRRAMRFPCISTALEFSYEAIGPWKRHRLPFGFHRMDSREILRSAGLLP